MLTERNKEFTLNNGKKQFNDLLSEWNNTPHAEKISTISGLVHLINNVESSIEKLISESLPETFEISGIKIKKSAIMGMIELPEYPKIRKLVQNCIRYVEYADYYVMPQNPPYAIDEAIILKDYYITMLEEKVKTLKSQS